MILKGVFHMGKIKKAFALLLAFSTLIGVCVFARADESVPDISIDFVADDAKFEKEFSVTITLTNNQLEKTYGSEFEFVYDSSVLEFSSFSSSADDTCSWETEILNNEEGLIYVASYADLSSVSDISSYGLAKGASIDVVLNFKAIGCGEATVSVQNAILLQGELFLDFDLSNVSKTIIIDYPAKISGASLLLDTGIRIVFYALIPEEYADAKMQFVQESTTGNEVSLGNPKFVSGADTESTGLFGEAVLPKYEFIIGSNPDKMGEKIHASLIYKGVEIASPQKYSVIDYCNKAFLRDRSYYSNYTNEQYSAFITLLCDMLSYGAASQEYTGHNKENLVTNMVPKEYELKPSEYIQLKTTDKEIIAGEISEPTIASASLALDSSFWLSYKIKAKSTDGIKISVHVDKGEESFEYYLYSDSLVQTGEEIYTLKIIPSPRGVDYAYSITVYDKDGNQGRTVKYSVKSYVYTYQGNETLGPIVQRLYCYATSIRNYSDLT